ncbi:DASH complex subunit Duo1 [Histoplasma capsulatum]|uniref:DASH complex subunit DUO1 n=1 Tax=Ajellomyces capsulatus TaxID=5037 RepID=A0A8A1MFS4_AJECA|nr:predicted protein [Histoplasma mississippiense (nom. inval.)]EDN02233.1 predicted protein [Histoplasma mississippiense (nom. inval.)]QSS64745.1 DASH complex subunit Duo1 [Histoplasma capsulatum]
MSISSARAEMEKLQFLDQDNEALPESPSKNHDFPSVPQNSSAATEANYGRNNESQHDREEAREFSLRSELESIRNINRVVEGIIHSLDRAKDNMENVSRTVASASTLLNTWTRILAQTEQNQRLILNPSWQGASKDIADIEGESILRQQEAERIELELQQRREAMARKAEEEERKKEATSAARGSRGLTRGRSRISGRTSSTTNSFGTTRGTVTARGTMATRGTTTRGTTSLRRPAASAPGTRGRGKVPGSS